MLHMLLLPYHHPLCQPFLIIAVFSPHSLMYAMRKSRSSFSMFISSPLCIFTLISSRTFRHPFTLPLPLPSPFPLPLHLEYHIPTFDYRVVCGFVLFTLQHSTTTVATHLISHPDTHPLSIATIHHPSFIVYHHALHVYDMIHWFYAFGSSGPYPLFDIIFSIPYFTDSCFVHFHSITSTPSHPP